MQVCLCYGAVLCASGGITKHSVGSELTERLQSQQSESVGQAQVSWCSFALVRYCASGGITGHYVSQS